MTILNTLANIGSLCASQAALFLIDWTTVTACYASKRGTVTLPYDCTAHAVSNSTVMASECQMNQGVCLNRIDGYEFMAVVCLILGMLWLKVMKPVLVRLQRSKVYSWHISPANTPDSDDACRA